MELLNQIQAGQRAHIEGSSLQRMHSGLFRSFIVSMAIAITGCVSTLSISEVPITETENAKTAQPQLDAERFLGADNMQSSSHRVAPQATLQGYMLSYIIETSNEHFVVMGTEQAKTLIREIHATDVLSQRSTAATILNSAKDRTTNLVETPLRLGKTLVSRASEINDVGDAVLFVPDQVGQAMGELLGGVGELAVTGVRVSVGAAGTDCSGLDCVGKAGSDIWSGVNSLAGKHNVSRRLHSEFGTDPETQNESYRRQINRLAYADSYTSTTIKLGAGQAGINYISPAFTGVGYYNNAEFIGQYEDARRQRNAEKKILLSWGADLRSVDGFYQNKAFTKQSRRRFFKALEAIPDKIFSAESLKDAANVQERYKANSLLVTYEYIATLAMNGDVAEYVQDDLGPLIISNDGALIFPLYANYLAWTPQLHSILQSLAKRSDKSAIHVLGFVGADVNQKALPMGVDVVEFQTAGL